MTQVDISFYALLIQSTAVVISLLGVASTIIYNGIIQRRRAALDLILMEETNVNEFDKRQKFVELRKKPHIAQWAAPDQRESEEYRTINHALNYYEIVAISIRARAVSGLIYKRWMRYHVVHDWIICKPYVVQIRLNLDNTALFKEFEWLALRWANYVERQQV